MLAEETGGVLVANTNNLAERLDRVSGDLDAYYEIAYAPTNADDGRFRKVEVKVARGVDVQSRSGYFALPPTDGAPLLPYEMPMLAAASTTPLPTPFRVGRRRSGSTRPRAACSTRWSRSRSISSRSRRTARRRSTTCGSR